MLSPADISLMTDRTIDILDSIDEWADEPTVVEVRPRPVAKQAPAFEMWGHADIVAWTAQLGKVMP